MNAKSFAIWYEPKNKKENDNPTNLEIHYNLWKLPKERKWSSRRILGFELHKFFNVGFHRFFDIGLMLNKAEHIACIKIYVPFQLERKDVVDLVEKVKSEDILPTVFNANYQPFPKNPKYYEVKKNDNLMFCLYQLSGADNISIEQKYEGTVISLVLQNEEIKDNVYVRIRIKGKTLSEMMYIYKPSNALFQSAFYQSEVIDFRMNEMRVLNSSLVEDMNKWNKIKFKKTHFFFICNLLEECTISHLSQLNCRRLESDRWKEYIHHKEDNIGIDIKAPILAYHWKKSDEEHEDYSVLLKTKYEHITKATISNYILILFLMSLAFNLVSSYLYEQITSTKSNTVECKHSTDSVNTQSNSINKRVIDKQDSSSAKQTPNEKSNSK